MSTVYVLRGRTVPKTVDDEAYDALLYTFAEVYSERDAAIAALKEHLADSVQDIKHVVRGATLESLLENGKSGKYSWYYRESDKSDESGTVAEWALSTENYMSCEEPVLPYFAVDACEVK